MVAHNLWQQYLQLKKENPYIYSYDIARKLGVSEGELLLSSGKIIYLGEDIKSILLSLADLDSVLSITRNRYAVSEKIGIYHNLMVTNNIGIAVNVGGIDVRIFSKKWYCALAFDIEDAQGNKRRSIQFFDHFGLAIQKIYQQEQTNQVAWDQLINKYQIVGKPQFKTGYQVKAPSYKELDTETLSHFQQRWLSLKDIHHFTALIEEYDLSFRRALDFSPQGYAYRLKPTILEEVYQEIQITQVPVITFIGNRGIIQIQTGPVHHFKRVNHYLNIFDKQEENFVMHLDEGGIEEVWLVTRPTRDGHISCLLAFDGQQKIILSLFGKRQEGQRELQSWRDLLVKVTGQNLIMD